MAPVMTAKTMASMIVRLYRPNQMALGEWEEARMAAAPTT
jgi:hypothetical protein